MFVSIDLILTCSDELVIELAVYGMPYFFASRLERFRVSRPYIIGQYTKFDAASRPSGIGCRSSTASGSAG